jgi:pyruvate/2-oxoglutarate/acetoin dehydrogenase E1 component
MGVPGLKIVAPSTPGDAKALLKASIQDDNPVLFLEHKRLYSVKGEVNAAAAELGRAAVRREGNDVTLVSAMKSVTDCLDAAAQLAQDGIDAEVIDLRTLRPLDTETVLASVAKTNRILVVEEGPRTGGWAGEVLARVTEEALHDLDDAWRLTTPDQPIPYSPPLEDDFLPSAEAIAASVRERLA